MFQELKTQISDNLNHTQSLRNLAELINDVTFLEEFLKARGTKWIISIYTQTSNNLTRSILLEILEDVSLNYVIPSDDITDEFLDELFNYCNLDNPDTPMICQIYRLLAYCIQNYEDLYEVTMDSIQLPKLIQTLMCANQEIHTAVLSLINTVYENTPTDYQHDLAQVMLEKNELRIIIYKYVLKADLNLHENLKEELSRLQNVLMHRELEGYITPINMDDNKIEEFKKLVSCYDPTENVHVVLKKLGFRTHISLNVELESPCNMLLVDCITFYVTKNANAAYYPQTGPSLFRLIKVATTEVTKNIETFTNTGKINSYFPCLFERPNGFQELICQIIKNHKTSIKDYPNSEDSEILSHLQEKVKRALLKHSFDFNHFHIELEKLDRNHLIILMTEEASKWSEKLKNLQPVNRLKDFYAPQVEELIKKQIYIKLIDGINAEIVTAQKSKKVAKDDSAQLRINSSFNAFEYTFDGGTTITIPLADIVKVNYGESNVGRIDDKLIKKVAVSSLVVFDMKNNEKYPLSIEPEYHRLIGDVINLAENKKIDDKWEPQSYTELLDAIIDVALMDLTEQDIPMEPPPIPPEPSDFNFSWTE